jgi:hypothetical protein
MNIVMITENDPAGMGIAFTNAINRLSAHHCRLITTAIRYNFEFEKDIHVPDLDEDGFEEIVFLLQEADIIHFHILSDENMVLGPVRVKDHIKGKGILHHHHGHPDFRSHPEKYREKYRKLNRKVLVSTPDLLRLLPEAKWQPNLVPIHEPLYRPLTTQTNGTIKICQSPTRKDLKNTSDFEKAVDAVKRSYPGVVEKVLVENTRHVDCLRMKRTCDIHFDHMQGYFGVSSLESLSQGKPVIAGLDDWNIRHIRKFTDSERLPWILARKGNELFETLKILIRDTAYRLEIGVQSRSFMEQNWGEHRILESLFRVYRAL